MNIRLIRRWLMVIPCVALMFSACSKSGGEPETMKSGVFDSASADVREKWQNAATSIAGRDYLGAATNLMMVFSKSQSFTLEQKDALQQAWVQLGNQAFKAGENGDQRAVQAVMQMNASRFGKTQGDR